MHKVRRKQITRGALALAIGAACALDARLVRAQEAGAAPLAAAGDWFAERGIKPNLAVNVFYQANPSMGVETGQSQSLTLIVAGADLDLARLAGIPGATVHFEQFFVPFISNLNYRAQLGDAVTAVGAPYVPKVSHLHTLTWQQKFLDGKLDIEVGKSNASYYFGTGQCNMLLTCQNAMLITAGGFNPFPYADWSARVGYALAPRWTVQAGAWRSNPNFYNHNGWQRRGDASDPVSTVYLANLVYRSSFAEEAYPATYEVMGYHNNATQTARFITPTGATAAELHDGTDGLYLGARKVIYRPDGGAGGGAHPRALSAYGSLTHSFDPGVGNGIAKLLHVGLIAQSMVTRRPLDSYSVNLDWGQLTRQRQRLNEASRLASGGPSYRPGRNEYALTLDANFVLRRDVVLSPYLRRTWNANNWFNPFNRRDPADGYAFGVSLHVGLDGLLGLRKPAQ